MMLCTVDTSQRGAWLINVETEIAAQPEGQKSKKVSH